MSDDFDGLLSTLAPGLTLQQIADDTGLSVRTLWRLRRGLGPRGASRQTVEALVKTYCIAKSEDGKATFRKRVQAAAKASRRQAVATG